MSQTKFLLSLICLAKSKYCGSTKEVFLVYLKLLFRYVPLNLIVVFVERVFHLYVFAPGKKLKKSDEKIKFIEK